MHVRILVAALIIFVSTFLFSCHPRANSGHRLLVYTPHGEDLLRDFISRYKQKYPDTDVQFLDMAATDPVFHAFFEIDGIDHFPQAYVSGAPVFKGIFEDNDRSKRLMAIINYNTDVSQFWEWSGRGFRPFDQTNEAYKLGVNYLVYALTH